MPCLAIHGANGRRQGFQGLVVPDYWRWNGAAGHVGAGLSFRRRTADAQQQWLALQAVPTGPNYLAAETIAWAQARPTDPRVPEALHLAVRATRYGCTDDETGQWSKKSVPALAPALSEERVRPRRSITTELVSTVLFNHGGKL